MKGLSLTLTVVVVAIALLVTVLVIITIFGGQMAAFLGIINPWSEELAAQNLCRSKCAAWCQANPGKNETTWQTSWKVTYGGKEVVCGTNVVGLPDKCRCSLVQ